MLCDITSEEVTWQDVLQSVPKADHILRKELRVSTITSVFKRQSQLPRTIGDDTPEHLTPKSVVLLDFMTFLTSTENSNVISNMLVRYMGQRHPLHIKLPDIKDTPENIKKPLGDFYNQMTLSVTDEMSTKSIKIFNNLTLHVTGCKSAYEARIVATMAWDMLSQVYPFVRSEKYTQTIQMMNSTAEVNYSFNLKNLSARLREHSQSVSEVKYDPMESDYPGALAKVYNPIETDSVLPTCAAKHIQPKQVTVMIFASGNLAFSGSSFRSIVHAYVMMIKFVEDYKHSISSKEPILSKKRQEETIKKRKYTLKGPRKNAKKVNAIVV